MPVGLLILPMKRMLSAGFSRMKTKKGLSTVTDSRVLKTLNSKLLVAEASVPISVTLSIALWDACGTKGRGSQRLG